jgi:hypothetical protein
MSTAEKHELISYNKKFKPGTAGVKLTFSPDEMAFTREDMPLRAAMARREILLSLQPSIDGVTKKRWNKNVLVVNPKEPFNPQQMYVTTRNEHDPDFRREFYEDPPHWDSIATIDHKLERRQLRRFTEDSRKGTVKASAPLASAPLLVRRQMIYARRIKEEGIPATKPPPPFVVKKPKMSQWSHRKIRQFDVAKPYHDGAYGEREALGGKAWSCCGNADEGSPGCRRRLSNEKRTLYD